MRHERPHWHDAYDAQMALWRFYRTPLGRSFLLDSYRTNASGLGDETRDMLAELYQGETTRLLDLDPIYVSADMCDVVEAAAETFQPEPLLETDLLTPRGFAFYARPFAVPDRFDAPTSIRAVAWQRIFNTQGKLSREEHEEFLARIDADWLGDFKPGSGVIAAAEEAMEREGIAEPWGVTLTIYADSSPELRHPAGAPIILPMHLTPWYFGMSFSGNEVDENGDPTGAGWWWRIVQTTLRLMQQRLAHRTISRPDRACRREAKRLGVPHEPEVVVVRLRREAGERSEPSGEPGNYSHRWIVGGHWRNQPYKDGVRQIWISPYVKGPKDRPLIVRPRRVYQWER